MLKKIKKNILKIIVPLIRSRFLSKNEILKKFKDPDIFVYCWKIFNKNIYMRLNRKSFIDQEILYNSNYSKNINFHIFQNCYPGSLYIDIGANIGTTALPVALHNHEIEVHAFEPNPSIFERLKINKIQNNCSNLFLHNMAVGFKKEKLPFYISQNKDTNSGLSSLSKNSDILNSKSIEVDVIKVDDFFEGSKKNISLIKVDVQGFEWQVLQGARIIINNHRPIIIFEHDDNYLSEPTKIKNELEKFFTENGYDVFEIDLFDLRRLNKVNWKQNLNSNLIAIKSHD